MSVLRERQTRRSGARRSASSEERFEAIKRSAEKWFFRKGYEGTDLRRIAADVDMQAGSLYNYISSKHELLFVIMKEGMDEILSGYDAALEGVEDPIERLRVAIRFHVLHHARRRYRSWTNHVEVRSLKGKRHAEIVALRDLYQQKWMDLVQRGVDCGALQVTDVHDTVFGILTMGQAVSRWFSPRGTRSAEEIANTYTTLLLQGLLPDDSPCRNAPGDAG